MEIDNFQGGAIMKKSISISLFALRQFVFALVLFMAIGFLIPNQASAGYSVGGSIWAYATPGGGDPITRSLSYNNTQPSVSDTATYTGYDGSVGQAQYFANLATGLIGTYVSGYCPDPQGQGLGMSGSGTADASFNDTLHLTIPSGTYNSDLYVTLSGFVNGYLSASGSRHGGESNVYEVGNFKLIGPGYFPSNVGEFSLDVNDTHIYSSTSPKSISASFDFTVKILAAGTLDSPKTVDLTVSAWLKGKGAAMTWRDGSASMLSDFYNTGGYTFLDVPAGVTWTSDSGVFIPEPATLLLLGLGSMMLRKRRAK